MAKKKDGGDQVKELAAQAGATTQPKGPKMPSTGKLTKLLGQARQSKADSAEIRGEYGASVKALVDDENLHKKAWSSCVAADRMEPEALADFFAHRDAYEEKLGLRKRAGNVIRMDFSGDREGGDGKPFPQPKGEAAE